MTLICLLSLQAFSTLVGDIAEALDKEGPAEQNTDTLRLGGQGNPRSSFCQCT